MYGGNRRGRGSSPSITSSSAFSSPNRYSSGPVTSVIGTSPTSPASLISRTARVNASISGSNDAFTARYAPTAPPAQPGALDRVDDSGGAQLSRLHQALATVEAVDVLVERGQGLVRQQDGHG